MLFIKMIKKVILVLLIITLVFLMIDCSPQASMINNYSKWKSIKPEKISAETKKIQASIPSYYRLLTSTYLTYPEWYIVYSSQEYADYLKSHLPSGFPYFASISQYWWGYGAVNQITKNGYPPDSGDHLMLMVIGVSYSVEYFIKGIYENTMGKATELLSGNVPTEEDQYAQKVAEEYAYYIPENAWFDFSFTRALTGLWTQTSLVGPHMIRKMERKFILSWEYGIKAVYSGIIQAASHLTYGVADANVYAYAENISNDIYKKYENIKQIKSVNAKNAIISLPSEQLFTDAVIKITSSGIKFNDIAGNNEILVTAITLKDWVFDNKNAELLFTMNILTQPTKHRIALRVPTESLLAVLQYLQFNNAVVEHVYAY